MRRAWSRGATCAATVLLAIAAVGCGATGILTRSGTGTTDAPASTTAVAASAPSSPAGAGTTPSKASTPQDLGFPYLATKNTTRVAGDDPTSDAAAVALAVFPSTAPGTHPTAVTLAPSDDWQAALAATSLMGSPFRAPTLLSTPGSLSTATATALKLLAPTGDPSVTGAQVIRIGNVPSISGLKSTGIGGDDPYTIAANIDAFEARQRHSESTDVVVTSAQYPAYAMPAAGWAAESGEPILYVASTGVPQVTANELRKHHHAHIYVLDPASAVSSVVFNQLKQYGTVKRVGGSTPAAESVTFAKYRDPACAYGQSCAHIPHSFGWAIRSPGHGYVLINQAQPLDAAAAAALSASGGYGPQLLVSAPNTLPKAVLNYFLYYATPGYTSEGPTAAVYNHAWLIGNASQISDAVQAQIDSILEVVPVK